MTAGATTYPAIAPSPAVHICLDLPVPPSVNRLRRIDWANHKKHKQWKLHADLHITAYGPRPPPRRMIKGPFELHIVIPANARADLDNFCKALIDYLVSREFVGGDGYGHLRRLIFEWGPPDPACHVTITGVR